MRIKANRSNLTKHARALLANEWSEEKQKELIRECLYGFERTHGHISHDRAAHIERIDRILGNYGVEGLLTDREGNDLSGNCSMDGVVWDVHYSNAGDTYAMTILYVNGKLTIGDWGSLYD
jgi:hypothetical protein